MNDPSISSPKPNMQQLRTSLPALTTFLHTFASSPSTFKLLTTITNSSAYPTPSQPPPSLPAPKPLYILDSSFNPPTLAHLRLATTALLQDTQPAQLPKRLLLLLATQNADKPPKPASFEQRLIMMEIFAKDLLSSISSPPDSQTPTADSEIAIDIGVTKLPYFHDKAASISKSGTYAPETQQVHLLGYDTLIRLLDTKYYPPSHSLSILQPFLSQHRLRVTYRPTSASASASTFLVEREEQDRYLQDLADGKREHEGGKREWVSERRIEMVEGRKDGEEAISSTRVRDAVKLGDRELLGKLLTHSVNEWVFEEKLYLDD